MKKHKHELNYNPKRGEIYCRTCGEILEDNCLDFEYRPEFSQEGNSVSREFGRPYLYSAGTFQSTSWIITCLSRRGRGKLRKLGVLR